MSTAHILDNVFWHTLVGPHAKYATGVSGARRYAPGFSPIVGFMNPQQPDLNALRPYCDRGEHFYCGGWSGVVPPNWCIDIESSMFLMVRDAELDTAPEIVDEAPDAVRLGPQHAKQAVELAALTRPGPFGLKTIELGEYFGYFDKDRLDKDRLIAMAGERMHAGAFHEISGVCTHPDFQGRGLARRLMTKLIARQRQRTETSFLHVMSNNINAHALYERMGFRNYHETVVRVISPR